jgi:hypothetical protein
MQELYNNLQNKNIVLKAHEGFCFGKSREIILKDYRDLLEVLA